MDLINPATEVVTTVEETPLGEIERMVARARQAQQVWARKSVERRAEILGKLRVLLENARERLAPAITDDMGKPRATSRSEVGWAAEEIEFFCKQAGGWLAREEVEKGYLAYDPLGVAAIVSPWNYPLLVPFQSIQHALLAGNAVVFKPSEFAVRTGLEIGRLLDVLEDFPRDLFQVVVGGKAHGQALVEADVDIVSFTGSTLAGKDILRKCAERLHKVLLELGGLDAAIVLRDAGVRATARKIVRINGNNSGQVCCLIKRVYVEKSIHDEFLHAAVDESRRLTIGDPQKEVDMGPLAARFQLEKVETFVEDARRQGAQVLSGGERLGGKGFFYPSTVLSRVHHDMRLLREEAFGPLLPVLPVASWEEGVAHANRSRYGLCGSVWTKDLELGQRIAAQLEVGLAGINYHNTGPLGTPWGGVKESGLGRTGTRETMRTFSNLKLVCVAAGV